MTINAEQAKNLVQPLIDAHPQPLLAMCHTMLLVHDLINESKELLPEMKERALGNVGEMVKAYSTIQGFSAEQITAACEDLIIAGQQGLRLQAQH